MKTTKGVKHFCRTCCGVTSEDCPAKSLELCESIPLVSDETLEYILGEIVELKKEVYSLEKYPK